jgi:hypothetical protein
VRRDAHAAARWTSRAADAQWIETGAKHNTHEEDPMSDTNSFAKLVPGFDFLQGLVKNAGAALPGIGQWVAPTLDPDELNKRIEELRTVQFWLEQNARMLGATIQALEVQKMTLTTLKTMNVQMSDLRDSLKVSLPEKTAPGRSAEATDKASKPTGSSSSAAGSGAASGGAGSSAPAVDPMQWWGALTKQFTELATSAMQESQGMAAAMGRRSFDGVDSPGQQGAPAAASGADKAESGDTTKPGRKAAAGARKRPGSASDKGEGS